MNTANPPTTQAPEATEYYETITPENVACMKVVGDKVFSIYLDGRELENTNFTASGIRADRRRLSESEAKSRLKQPKVEAVPTPEEVAAEEICLRNGMLNVFGLNFIRQDGYTTPNIESMMRAALASLLRARDQANAAKIAALESDVKHWERSYYEMQRMANGLYDAIIKRLKPYFPEDTRDLDWDVLPGTIAAQADSLKSFIDVATAHGWTETPGVTAAVYLEEKIALLNSLLQLAESQKCLLNANLDRFIDESSEAKKAILATHDVEIYPGSGVERCKVCGKVEDDLEEHVCTGAGIRLIPDGEPKSGVDCPDGFITHDGTFIGIKCGKDVAWQDGDLLPAGRDMAQPLKPVVAQQPPAPSPVEQPTSDPDAKYQGRWNNFSTAGSHYLYEGDDTVWLITKSGERKPCAFSVQDFKDGIDRKALFPCDSHGKRVEQGQGHEDNCTVRTGGPCNCRWGKQRAKILDELSEDIEQQGVGDHHPKQDTTMQNFKTTRDGISIFGVEISTGNERCVDAAKMDAVQNKYAELHPRPKQDATPDTMEERAEELRVMQGYVSNNFNVVKISERDIDRLLADFARSEVNEAVKGLDEAVNALETVRAVIDSRTTDRSFAGRQDFMAGLVNKINRARSALAALEKAGGT